MNLPGAGTGHYAGSNIVSIADNGDWLGVATSDAGHDTVLVHLVGHQLSHLPSAGAFTSLYAQGINNSGEVGISEEPQPQVGAFVGLVARPTARSS